MSARRLPHVLKNFSVFIDGRGYMGTADTVDPPKFSRKVEKFRAGGMDTSMPIDLGSEDMEITLGMLEYVPEILKLYDRADAPPFAVMLRGHAEKVGEASTQSHTISARCTIVEFDPAGWKAGDKAGPKFKLAVHYVKWTIDGQDVIEVDPVNMVFKVDGKDRMAVARQNLGG